MLTDDFLVELTRVRDQFKWVLVQDRTPGSERRARPRFSVRCSAWNGPAEGIVLCPIGAVCYALTKTLYEPDYFREAAKAIELAPVSASELNAAAADRTWKGGEGDRAPDPQLASLRDQIIQAVGLTARV